jgi:hypothetical protein
MTAEHVFALSRAYQCYYKGTFDFQKYHGKMPCPPLIQQRDRQFYHRIANHLDDATIHALFTLAYFYKPNAYIADLVTRDIWSAANVFASRTQNGRPLFESELYDLSRRFVSVPSEQEGDDAPAPASIHTWLYANGMPACIQEVIRGDLPLDLACLLLLIPRPTFDYDWPAYWFSRPDASVGLGPQPWIERLKKADLLIWARRTGWRVLSHELARDFWACIGQPSLAPIQKNQTSLFP